MEAQSHAALPRTFETFESSVYWNREEESDTCLLSLPEFNKDQLRVQVDSLGNVKVTGERPLEGNKWSRFHKEIHVPENCKMDQIRARFDNGTLVVVMPKTVTHTP